MASGPNISYVYPNLSELNRCGRGTVAARWEQTLETGCHYVEMPADFVKNKTEVTLTGLDLGSLLPDDAVRLLYNPTAVAPTYWLGFLGPPIQPNRSAVIGDDKRGLEIPPGLDKIEKLKDRRPAIRPDAGVAK
jgi:hypothetical protein